MKNSDKKTGISLLFGLTFFSPITFSVLIYEMDMVQRVVYFVFSLLLFLVFIRKSNIKQNVQLNKSLFILMAFYPLTFLTCFFNGSSSLFILKLSDLTVTMSIVLQSAMMFIILGEEKFFKVVSYSVVIVSTIFSIIGMFEVFNIIIIDLPTVISPGSTLGNRSFAAEYLLPTLPMLIILKEFISKEKRIYLLIAGIINVSFLLFTRNRSGLIILMAITILFIIFILIKKEKQNKIFVLSSVLGVLLLSFFISLIDVKGTERPDFQSTAGSLFDSEFKSNVLRLSFWDASFQMIEEHPITGVGLYKWSGYYPKYNGEYFTDENVTHIHNIHAHSDFLELFAENGLLAALVFLLIYILTAVTLFKRIKYNENYFYLLLSFLITFAYSLVAFPNFKFASYFLAAVITGPAIINLHKISGKLFTIKFLKIKWLLFIFLIIGLSTSYVKLRSELFYGEAIFLKDRAQYPLMQIKLDQISEIFYPFDASKQPIDYYKAIANSRLTRYSEALNNNLKGQELAPYNPILIRNIASSYYGLKNLKKAIQQYEKVKIYFPNYITPQINLLDLYAETGQLEKEKSLYSELEKKSPDNPRLIPYRNKFQSNE